MRVFLSYRHSNKFMANLLYYALLSQKIDIYIDKDRIIAGGFPAQLTEAVKKCEYFIVVVDSVSLEERPGESDWYRDEIKLAIKENKRIIPVIIDKLRWPQKCNWPELWIDTPELSDYQTVTLNENIDITIKELVGLLDLPFYEDTALQLLKKAVSNCETKNITEYILQSHEMSLQSNSEVHLLTDNFRNYDFTVIAKMAISRNISNGTKYIYYCLKDCEEDFYTLQDSIRGFINRDTKSNNEIDCWLRERFLYDENVYDTINSINHKEIKKAILELAPTATEQMCQKIEELFDDFCILKSGNYILDLDFVIEWIQGKRITSNAITDIINSLKKIEEIVKTFSDYSSWKFAFKYLSDIFTVSKWILNPQKTDIDNEKKYRKICKQYGVDSQIIDWLCLKKELGSETVLKNLVLCVFDSKDVSFSPCFSFSYIISPSGSYEVGAWYTGSYVKIHDVCNENTVAVYSYTKEEIVIVKKLFKNILNTQPLSIINSINSYLTKR